MRRTEENLRIAMETVPKAAQARSAMWSAMTNVLGLMLAAESVIAVIRVPSWLVIAIPVFCFCGVLLLLRCFQLQHSGYIDIIESNASPEQSPYEDRIAKEIRKISLPDPIRKAEKWAFGFLYLSSILFIFQACLAFFAK